MRMWSMLGMVLVGLGLVLVVTKQPPNRQEPPRQQHAGPILTADPGSGIPAKPKSAAVAVKKVVFVNGASYDGAVTKALEPMASAVKGVYPNATFKVEAGQLLVGLEIVDAPRGEIFSVSHQSDCPVNSIYRYHESQKFAMGVLEPMLIAWTRGRHDRLGLGSAEVKAYTQGEGRAEVVLRQ